MSLDEDFPKTCRRRTRKIEKVLESVSGMTSAECEDLAMSMNSMADKAVDLNEIVDRLLSEQHSRKEIGELLLAFEMTTEQIRGHSDAIDGKLYDISDRLSQDQVNHRLQAGPLPRQRGRFLLELGEPMVPDGPKWFHFSWRGESFCLRDFLRGEERRQRPGETATVCLAGSLSASPSHRQIPYPSHGSRAVARFVGRTFYSISPCRSSNPFDERVNAPNEKPKSESHQERGN